MQIYYDGTAARGAQWTIIKNDGTALRGVSRATALGALMGEGGKSIRQSAIAIAAAKLAAASAEVPA